MKRTASCGLLLAAAIAAAGCDLDFDDPNSPTEASVFAEGQNLILVAIGLQAEAAAMVGPYIFSSSLASDETGAGEATFANFMDADIGNELLAGQYLSEQPWIDAYRVVKLANDLLRAVPDANLSAGTRSGIIAMAKTFKAMAFGHLSNLYEAAPIDAGIDNPDAEFSSREQVLAEAIALLQSARSDLQSTPASGEFLESIQAPGFDLAVTIPALLARYQLWARDYAAAAQEAAQVPPGARSEFRFTPTVQNPVFNILYDSGNPYQLRARQEVRLDAEEGDERVAYWVEEAAIEGAHRILDHLAKYRTAAEPFPIFLPDEPKLIRAEAAARTGDLATARSLINEVRTQCGVAGEPAACLEPLGEAESPDEAAVLAEILRQRRYELYLQGVRFDDLRRFNAQRKYDFLPLPQTECDRNPSAPC